MALIDILKTFSDEKEIVVEDGKYVEKDKDGLSLKGVLQRGRLRLRKEKKLARHGLGFRPSGITYHFCRRLKVGQLAGLLDIWDESPRPALQFAFDVGHAYHNIIQGYFWDIGVLRGDFYCIKCDKVYKDLLSPARCPERKKNSRSVLAYREVQATHDEYKIRGRCDGILELDGEYHIMDIKSIMNRQSTTPQQSFCFEDLEVHGPKEDHIIQLTLYMWILNITKGHLLYAAKNDHKIKTYAIPYDYDIIAPYLEDIKSLLQTAKRLSEGERVQLPEPCGRADCPCETVITG